MELIQMLQDLMNKISEAAAKIAELQAKLQDAQNALDVEVKAAYDKGFADGQASIPKSDKIYSQEELDKSVSDAVAPVMAKVVELEAVVAGIDQKILDAVMSAKAEIKAKLDALEESF